MLVIVRVVTFITVVIVAVVVRVAVLPPVIIVAAVVNSILAVFANVAVVVFKMNRE